MIKEIPRFFDIVVIGINYDGLKSDSNRPKYLEASFKTFGYGTQEAKVVFRSVGLPQQIEFNANTGNFKNNFLL